jgi:hypothetical protein
VIAKIAEIANTAKIEVPMPVRAEEIALMNS